MFTVEIAGIPIAISNRFSMVKQMCRFYIKDKPALFEVKVSEEEMLKETGAVSPHAEWLCVYRHIALAMNNYDGFLMHAAVIDIDGQGLAFTAKSSTGKTTRVSLWKKAFGQRVRIVNGDKPILRFMGDTLYAFGTPWMGKENYGENSCVPLKYVCFLERGSEVSIQKMQTQDVLSRLFGQVLVPKEGKQIGLFMRLLERFVESVKFFLLICDMEKEDPEHIWRQMQEADF